MKYIFTDPETHMDFGFGLLASNFHSTANYLWDSNPNRKTTGLLPNLYLYRHSIELYLKSLIIIIHKKMKLNYKNGTIPFDSREPYIGYTDSNGIKGWKKITNSHFISSLYDYFKALVLKYEDDLREKSSQEMSIIINPENQKIVDHIKKYDDRSTFFRYFDLSTTISDDKEVEKKYNKRIPLEEFHPDENKPSSAFLVINEINEIVEIHQTAKDMPLKELGRDLRNLADYLSGIHVMFRTCLCNGF
ncbi:hypothetical protein QNH23_02140 [Siminovitchia fortis]|uniref:Uncharacterized protein n=1 Tax=Siminovitchia fortis TaxID=254758 RepID=A0A443IL95_9BACI|nr:hypothetical protein [Siminovitchia fortis]RWR05681.1 hypothetical protein D4N35_015300 [Siminovitchia fortis]WHY82230.1 hypothetical protein QNH23_02140 [Siminovitchia fortis]